MPPSNDVFTFSAPVRQRDSKDLTITNDTNVLWNLRPIIEGDNWCGADALVVPALTTAIYKMTYCPLTMTTVGQKHAVGARSLFFLMVFRLLCRVIVEVSLLKRCCSWIVRSYTNFSTPASDSQDFFKIYLMEIKVKGDLTRTIFDLIPIHSTFIMYVPILKQYTSF